MNKLFFKIIFVLSLIIISNQYLLAHQWTGQSTIPYNDGEEDYFTDYRARIFYGANGSNYNNKINNPVIVFGRPEFGFQPRFSAEQIYQHLNQTDIEQYTTNPGSGEHYRMLDLLREEGFDIIIVDFRLKNRIQTNAMALVDLLEFVNSKTMDEITIIGLEVGGMISRYALTYMENQANNIEHNVKLHITYDTPHQGINIPISIQWLLYQVADMAPGLNSVMQEYSISNIDLNYYAQELPNQFESYHSVQQLMNVSFKRSHDEIAPNGYYRFLPSEIRQQFLQELISLGDYPELCKNVAISTGSLSTNQSNSNGTKRFFMKTNNSVTSSYNQSSGILHPFGMNFEIIVHPIRESISSTGGEGYISDETFYSDVDANSEPDIFFGKLDLFIESVKKTGSGISTRITFPDKINYSESYLIPRNSIGVGYDKTTIAYNESGSYFVYEDMLRDFIIDTDLWGVLYHYEGEEIDLPWYANFLGYHDISVQPFDFILFDDTTMKYPEDISKRTKSKSYPQNTCYIPTSSALDTRDHKPYYQDFLEITLSKNGHIDLNECEYDKSYVSTNNNAVGSMGVGSYGTETTIHEKNILFEIFTTIKSYNKIIKNNITHKFTQPIPSNLPSTKYNFNLAKNNIYIGNNYEITSLDNELLLEAGNEIIFESGTNIIPETGNGEFETMILTK